MPEVHEMGQMTPAVKYAHEERMENYQIQMRSYTEAQENLTEIVEELPRKETEASITV
jgi:hypothetical protein